MMTLTSHDLSLIRLALNITSNTPPGNSDHAARLNAEMRELVERIDQFIDNQDYRKPGLFKVAQ
jgi:hypothetical protein